MTLSEGDGHHTVTTKRIAGPENPHGLHDIQVTRVADRVVAYGSQPWTGTRMSYWFMWVYSIATGEWEEIPHVDGESPTARSFPLLFGLGDDLVLTGGRDVDHTEDRPIASPGETWTWSVDTHRWTRQMDVPYILTSRTNGSAIGDTYHAYCVPSINNNASSHSTCKHLTYSHGRWEAEQDVWMGVAESLHRGWDQISSVSLSGHRQLLVIQNLPNYPRGRRRVTEYWLRDTVSLDVEPLLYPTHDGSRPPGGESELYRVALLINPTTLLVLHDGYKLVISIDPCMTSPECNSSMVGHSMWNRRTQELWELSDTDGWSDSDSGGDSRGSQRGEYHN
ncbi:hypothetical protein KIPB_007958 [Kipferlia bialata]|uniref:Kelch-type beta propeller n=1 Tax=Kipferlia bialata TaxID=797122 RepID=A0A391NN96_9EUKA|nr:hypothetical protein KIPB_007958 [Kipferlia bialata]|eukprot:g7958.t1